jgi:hypothetical protein
MVDRLDLPRSSRGSLEADGNRINQLVSLLRVLDCSVDLVVTDKDAVA